MLDLHRQFDPAQRYVTRGNLGRWIEIEGGDRNSWWRSHVRRTSIPSSGDGLLFGGVLTVDQATSIQVDLAPFCPSVMTYDTYLPTIPVPTKCYSLIVPSARWAIVFRWRTPIVLCGKYVQWCTKIDANNLEEGTDSPHHCACIRYDCLDNLIRYRSDLIWDLVDLHGGIYVRRSGSTWSKQEGQNPKQLVGTNTLFKKAKQEEKKGTLVSRARQTL